MSAATRSDNWRHDCKTSIQMLSKARRNGMFVDVHFSVGRKNFSAHKLILACNSPVFEAMFFGQLSEKSNPIVIPDDDPEAFDMLLRFLYGEATSFSSVPVACKTYTLGDKYLIPRLQAATTAYIATVPMNGTIFWSIIENNLFFNAAIENRCRRYISKNIRALLKSDLFLKTPEDIVEVIVQMESINISEFDLLMAVSLWGHKNYCNDVNINRNMLTFLRHIRFSSLSIDEFCRFSESFPKLIDQKSSFAIVKHIYDTIYKLPAWCSSKGLRGL